MCYIRVSFLLLLSLGFVSISYTQTLNELFQEAEELLNECKDNNAELLSPSKLREANDKYLNAIKLRENKKANKEVETELRQSITSSKKVIENIEIGQKVLKEAIESYSRAKSAKSSQFAEKEWKSAQSLWNDVIQDLEKGAIDNVRKNNDLLISRLQIAEREAVKNSLLLEARKAIQSARKIGAKTFAPTTLGIAEQALDLVEKDLNSSPKVTDRIIRLAQTAKIEAKHSEFITGMALKLRKDENGWEKGFLDYEEQINSIAKRFNQEIDWSNGPNKAGQQLLFYLDSLISSYESQINLNEQKYAFLESRFIQTREQLENELSEIQEKYGSLEAKLGVSEKEAQQLKIRQSLTEKVNRINSTISPNEVTAQISEMNQILIRVKGSTFPLGSSKISAQYQKILDKLIDILQDFSTASYVIEGHTDSSGDNDKNLKLSQDRANAIATIFRQSLGLTQQRVKAVGKGEELPIADNETYAGRLLNRRIDIYLKP